MNPLTRNWLIVMLIGWSLLAYGWSSGSTWAIGASLVIFLVSTVERYENWLRGRR
jgi:hypothetical protein